jgi:hypothetical protein
VQLVVLILASAFIALLGGLTAGDFRRYGVTPLGVVAALVVALLALAVLGSLARRPPRR